MPSSQPKAADAIWLSRWAGAITVGSTLGIGYFLSRWWWFGHAVPLFAWGSEVALIALGTIGTWALAWKQQGRTARKMLQAARRPGWLWAWGWLTWLSLGLTLTPSSFWEGNFQAAVLWQHSLLLWFWLVWVGGSAWFLGWKQQGQFRPPSLDGWKVFASMLALWGIAALFVLTTGLGWRAAHYWQGVGVPILSGQIWLLLTLLGFGITAARWAPSRFWQRVKARDTIAVVLLWLVAFGVWWQTTPAPTHFQPAAFPPNYQRYPFSDAERYALGGEQGVLGYGYFASRGMPRGAVANTHLGLAGLLALIEVWTQRVPTITAVLLLLLAWTPALLYLLGAMVHSRAAGFLLAGVEILRERNAISHADLFYVTSHVHMWATEPLLREIFVLLTLAAVVFLQHPWKRKPSLFAIGALLAFGFLVRREVLALMALSLVLALPVLFAKGRWAQRGERAVVMGSLLLAGMIAVLIPWMARGHVLASRLPNPRAKVSVVRTWFLDPIGAVLSPKFRPEVLQEDSTASPPSSKTSPPAGATPFSPTATSHTTALAPSVIPSSTLSPTGGATLPSATATPRHPAMSPTPAPPPTALAGAHPSPTSGTPKPSGAGSLPTFFSRLSQWHGGLALAMGDLFTRNVLALMLTFPPVVRFYPLAWVVGEKAPLWRNFFTAPWFRLPPETALLLLVQIVALSVGMAAVWRKRREAIAFLLGLMVVYLGVSAAARDAGGRYIVPLDWVLPLFAAVGWVVLLQDGWAMFGGTLPAWLHAPLNLAENPRRLARHAKWLGGGVVLLSWAMVALEFGAMGWVAYSGQAGAATWPGTTPPRWRPATSDEILHRLDILSVWEAFPWSREEIQQALSQHKVKGGWGFLFYPRYVSPSNDCGSPCWDEGVKTPSLLFAGLLGGQGQVRFRIPLATAPPLMGDGSEMIVLFCKPVKCHGFACADALALVQISRGNSTPQAGKATIFVLSQATLSCPQR